MTMRLSTEDIVLIIAALNRAISRYESEARYAKDGRGASNYKNVAEKAKKMRDVRDRILRASSIELNQ